MIDNIQIKNYKCFRNENISLKNLTLLTGTNSSGKSSCIQSILFLSNYASGSDIEEYLESLGAFEDLKNKKTNPKSIKITSIKGNQKIKFTMNKQDDKTLINDVDFLNYPKNITYLNANRAPISEINNFSKLKDRYFGIDGKYIISYYEQHKGDIISLIYDNKTKTTLGGQVDFWLKYIFSIELDFITKKISTTHTKSLYKIDNIEYKPENLGTGISYLISILIACLSAKEGNIIIIDNPEIHLHPKAQSKLLNFFSFISNQNIQLIIESHSDHIFNGI
jgi:predicted ATPase